MSAACSVLPLQLTYPDNSFKEYSEWFMKMSMFVVDYQNYWKIVLRLGYLLRSAEYTAWCNHYVSCIVDRFRCTFKCCDHASVLSYISELFLTRVFFKCIWWCYHFLYRFVWFYFCRALPPSVMWAQRNNIIFLTICLEDCKNPEIKIDNDKVYFHGLGGTEKKNHEVTIELYKEIDPEVFICCVKVVALCTAVQGQALRINFCTCTYNLQIMLFLNASQN